MPHAPLVIVNPTAGSGRAGRIVPWIGERLERRPDARLVITRRAGQAEELAASAAARGHERVVVVGGDGTVQEAVNGVIAGAERVSLGIVPVGSGNDLARSLGLPRDPAEAWTVAIGEPVRAIDVARAEDGEGLTRRFASAGGIGFDAQVAAAMATRSGWQRGQAGYLLTTLSELRRFANRELQISIDGRASSHRVLFVAVANGEYYGGGMRIAPGATVDDARLDVCIVGDVSRLTALRQLANLYRGTHVRHPQVALDGGRELTFDGEAATRIHLDGEPWGRLPLRITVEPGRIDVATGAPRRATVG
ncbi:MAG TPA: YegS/Rv2252/BmrU family lipid kinase [Candidatus Limnocylindria bacterium]